MRLIGAKSVARKEAIRLFINEKMEWAASGYQQSRQQKHSRGRKAGTNRAPDHKNGKRRVILIDIMRRIGYNYTN